MSFKRIQFLVGNALAGFLDFCVGTAIVTVMGHFFQLQVAWWFLVLGGVLAFLPDFDIIFPILKQGFTGKEITGDHHQTVFHRPILLLSAIAVVSFILGGTFWLTVALTCVIWHYIHDTNFFGMGGIAWFWPISKKYWSPTKGFDERKERREKTHTQWIEIYWLRPSPLSIIEITLGVVAFAYSLSQYFF